MLMYDIDNDIDVDIDIDGDKLEMVDVGWKILMVPCRPS
jgi:hypothetical protein